ncbi:MAG TPA: hypothetical protein VMM15_29645 [Bradyrhizobium sp.]|nr:hypothetical protein [Bradyrhizobium sp.]
MFDFFASRFWAGVSHCGGFARFGRSRLSFAPGAPEIGLSLESDGEQDEENRFVSNGASNGVGIGLGR